MTEWIITSCFLIIVVIALRYMLKGKIKLRLQYALWGIVLLRLLIPFSFGNSIMSVMNLSDTVQEQPAIQTISNLTQTNIPTQSFDSAYKQVVRDYESRGVNVSALESSEMEALDKEAHTLMAGPSIAELLKTVCLHIWIAGMVIVGTFFIVVNLRFSAKLKWARDPLNVSGYTLPVFVVDSIETPCLHGLIRPIIYITPEAAENKRILSHVLEHEITHYRHGDHIWSILRGACLTLHWYNPLVWCAAIISRSDSELACDEGTIKRIGEQERIEYGRTLIGMTCQKHTNLLLAATTMTGGKNSIKERVLMIAKSPKMAVYTLAAVILIAVAAIGCTFTGAKESKDETISKEENESISEAETETVNQDAAETEAIAIKTDIQGKVPSDMLDWAMEYVQQDIDYYNKLGAYPPDELGYTITDAKITGLSRINTGTASLENGVDMYLLEYRLLPDQPANVRLEGGMSMADGWITERSSNGQPYMLISWDHSGGEKIWQRICVTNTNTITQVYGTSEMIEQYGNAYTAAAMELYKNFDSSYDSLDVIAAMKAVKASDFVTPTVDRNVTAEELAYVLNTSVEDQINEADAISAGYNKDSMSYWWVEAWEITDLYFRLYCGPVENIVEINIYKDGKYDTAYFQDEVLYQMVRHSMDYEEVIDKAAFTKFEDILVPQMDQSLAGMSENEGSFTGYQLTRFHLLWSYENQSDGSRVELFNFNYALLTDHPEDVVMAGGTYIDSELRIQGFNYPGQFIVKYRGDEVVCTTFLNENNRVDLPLDADSEKRWIEHINEKLDLAENSQS